jgi:anaerobic magnesium-protoporphyrin IX monomethyl ester cyclase
VEIALFSLDLADAVPLALHHLRAHLLSWAPELRSRVTVHALAGRESWDRAAVLAQACAADVVGFTCCLWNVEKVAEVAEAVKAHRPGCRVVLGGPEASPRAAELLARHPCLDVVVRDEGEETFSELVRAYLGGRRDLGHVRGLTWRDGDHVVTNRDRPPVRELDALPSPHAPGLLEPTADRVIPVETQRGCSFRCGFCYYGKGHGRVRAYSLERVKQDLAHVFSFPVAGVYMMDPTFDLPLERSKEILRHVMGLRRRGTFLQTEIRAELVDDEYAELLRLAGATKVEVGLQSMEPHVLQAIHRSVNRRRFLEGMGRLARQSVQAEVQLIAGLPGDTWAGLLRSVRFVRAHFPSARLSVFPFLVLPGTDLRERAEALGIRYDPRPPYTVLETPTMSARDLARAAHLSNAHELLADHGPALAVLRRERGWPPSAVEEELVDWLADGGVRELPARRSTGRAALAARFVADLRGR